MIRITTILTLAALAGCTAGKADVDEDFTDLAGLDDKADLFSAKLKLLGSLTDGAPLRARYTSTPRFRGYQFTAAQGDQVDVWVRSSAGDALAWVVDGTFRVIAKNDDASADTYDAHIVTTLPASGVAGGRYYVIYRDYDLATHYFTVSYGRRPALPGDGAWATAAEAEVERMVGDYTGLAAVAVPKASLPAAARARVDASAAVLEIPTTYKLTVGGRPLYLVLATDGSGEGNVVVVDLIDGGGRWFAHGIGHSFWDGAATFDWGHDPSDPTMCTCANGPGQPATCTWMDGTTSRSTEIVCE